MRLNIQTKGDFRKTKAWLSKMINKAPVDALRIVAKQGEDTLAQNTPKDTGETAAGWVSDIATGRRNHEVTWSNVAHPHTSVNIARIIDSGHGTGTGGYVPPRPYIVRSMDETYKRVDARFEKELFE